jgi:hypothetical protein
MLMREMDSDGENESQELFDYYVGCTKEEAAAVNIVMLYLCRWSFATLLRMCWLSVNQMER